MSDATGAAEALLGLPGFRVLEVHEAPSEVIPGCGVVARAHGRAEVDDRDLACFGPPGAASLAQAPLPLRGARLRAQHLERDLAGDLRPLSADQPGRP